MCKPIIILLASVCEAILCDLHMRIKEHTSKGVRNITRGVIQYISNKRIEKFDTYIKSTRKHDFFDASDSDLYDVLDGLRKLRNRVHIQNSKKHFERDERKAFSHARQIKAEEAVEKILKTMAAKYARSSHATGFVEDFVLPWKEHYS